MTLGEKLQALRAGAELSQEELAERLGVSRQAISKWELDKTVPEVKYIVALSGLFGVTTDALLKDAPPALSEAPCPERPASGPQPAASAQSPRISGREQAAGLLLSCGNTLFLILLLFYLGKLCLWRENSGRCLGFVLISAPLLITLCHGLLWGRPLSPGVLRRYRRGVASAVVLMGFSLVMPFGFAEVVDDLLISQVEGPASLPILLGLTLILLALFCVAGCLIAHLLIGTLEKE